MMKALAEIVSVTLHVLALAHDDDNMSKAQHSGQ